MLNQNHAENRDGETAGMELSINTILDHNRPHWTLIDAVAIKHKRGIIPADLETHTLKQLQSNHMVLKIKHY